MKTHFYTRPTKSGDLSIYCRLIDGKREAFSTGLVIPAKNWIHEKQSIVGSDLIARFMQLIP